LFKKIAIIAIISFANLGSGQTLYQNSGFFILILTCLCFWVQMQWNPFITEELNSLELKASIIMIMTIFGGLFSSVCEDSTLQTILMVLIILLNVYFIALFFKIYLQIQLSFAKNSKLLLFLSKAVAKFWSEGSFSKNLLLLLNYF